MSNAFVFKDNQDRPWTIAWGWGEVKRLKTAGLDVLALPENKFAKFTAIMSDEFEFRAVLWLCVQPQAEKAGVSEDDFNESLDAPHINAAGDAFTSAVNFSIRSPAIRSCFERLIDGTKEMTDRQTKRLEKLTTDLLTKQEATMAKVVDEAEATALTALQTASEQSSGTPALSA